MDTIDKVESEIKTELSSFFARASWVYRLTRMPIVEQEFYYIQLSPDEQKAFIKECIKECVKLKKELCNKYINISSLEIDKKIYEELKINIGYTTLLDLEQSKEMFNQKMQLINNENGLKNNKMLENYTETIKELLLKAESLSDLEKIELIDEINAKIDMIDSYIEEARIIGMQSAYNDSLAKFKDELDTIKSVLRSKASKLSLTSHNVFCLLINAFEELGYIEKNNSESLNQKYEMAGSGNFTKYTEELDQLEFNTGRKQGIAWCDMFIDYLFINTFGETGAREITNQFSGRKHGAGNVNSAAYYADGLIPTLQFLTRDKSSPRIGSQIFFNNGKSRVQHTGLVVGVDSEHVYTIEGNTLPQTEQVVAEGRGVYLKRYKLNDPKIEYYGHPNYADSEYSMKKEDVEEITKIVKNLYLKIYENSNNILVQNGFISNKTEKKHVENPFLINLIKSLNKAKAVAIREIEDLRRIFRKS